MNPVETKLPRISTASPHSARVASSGRTHSATRETLLRLVEAQPEPVTIASLATLSGCHENTVRGHMQALWRDGFVGRELAPVTGQGRPSWLWHAVAPTPDSPYAGLAIALAEGLAATGAEAPDRARAVGEQWGRTLAATLPPATTPDEARRTVLAVMQNQGFAPHAAANEAVAADAVGDDTATHDTATHSTETHNTETHDIKLRRCPLVAAATHRPEIVCAVHLGMIAGALEGIGAHDAGSTLTPMSGPGECTLTLRVRA